MAMTSRRTTDTLTAPRAKAGEARSGEARAKAGKANRREAPGGEAPRSVREANVEAFLDAAERLLIREGAAGISTRRLAEEAGQNHGLVHYYFGSVDELLLQALERFTSRILQRQRAMYGTDAPFAQKWRTAMSYIERDLAAGYPKVWAELEALAWNRPELRERLRSVSDQWRSLLRDALTEAIEAYGLNAERFSAEALAALVMQFNKGLLFERLLGFDRGHAQLLAAIDGWLASLEEAGRAAAGRRQGEDAQPRGEDAQPRGEEARRRREDGRRPGKGAQRPRGDAR